MRSNITQLMIGTAVAIGMSVVAVSAIGRAVAHSPEEPSRPRLPGLFRPACKSACLQQD
jgi:hypothetical protein